MVIGTIVESKPAQYLRQLPMAARVMIITTIALGILAGIYFAKEQMGTAAALLSSSGLMTFVELIRRLITPKPKTAVDEPTFTIHSYAPDKLKEHTTKAISQPDTFCTRETSLVPLDLLRKPEFKQWSTLDNPDSNIVGTFNLEYNKSEQEVPIIGIFDGKEDEGEASSYMATNFIPKFKEAVGKTGWGLSNRVVANALTQTFVELSKTYSGPGYSDATVAMTVGNKVYIPSIGTSKAARITADDAHFLTQHLEERHIGAGVTARPKISCIEKKEGDKLLLASSYFWKYLSLGEVKDAIDQMGDLSNDEKVSRLIDLAQTNGCTDEITLVLKDL